MIKGISQAKRDNAWHQKNTNRKSADLRNHNRRVVLRSSGALASVNAERQFKLAQQRELQKHVGFWARLRYFWLRAKIKTNSQMRRLTASLNSNSTANA